MSEETQDVFHFGFKKVTYKHNLLLLSNKKRSLYSNKSYVSVWERLHAESDTK